MHSDSYSLSLSLSTTSFATRSFQLLNEMNEEIALMVIDIEMYKSKKKHGGFVPDNQTIHRWRQEGHCGLMVHYFTPNYAYVTYASLLYP